jgi:putative ABC transport system permease protein
MRTIGVLVWLALRSILRETRRSLLTASAMALGLALLILSRALADGAHEDWIEAGVRWAAGHVAIQSQGYLESGSIDDHLEAGAVQAALNAVERGSLGDQVQARVVRLTVSGLASSPTAAVPVRIMGVEPERESVFSELDQRLVDGRYLEPGDRLSAYVGVRLVERLGLEVGSRFVLTAQGVDGQIEGQLVRVAGTFRTGIEEMDEGVIHMPLGTARSWLAASDVATTVAVLLASSRDVSEAVFALETSLAGAGVRVVPWRESAPELDSAVRMDDYGDYVFHTILFAIVALAILNAVLMSVLYRKREFGVLQALGLSPRENGLLVLVEGVLLTAFAGLIGIVLGFGVTWGFFRDGLDLSFLLTQELTFSGLVFDPVMVPEFRIEQVIQSVAFILVIGIVASLYPAYHATKLDPAEAVKWEG